MKIRNMVCVVVIVVIGAYLNSAKAVTYRSERPLGEPMEIVAARQQLQRAIDALEKDPDYLTYIDIAELQTLINAIAYYVNIVDIADLGVLQEQAREQIAAGDLTGYKHLLDKINEVLKLEPETELYFGATIEARD